MNKTAILTALWLVFCALPAAASPMTKLERQRVIAHLEMTGSWLVSELSGLSPSQVQYRPAPASWSILEVLDHLVVSESVYWQDLRKALKSPGSQPSRPDKDADVLWYGVDRTERQKAVKAEEPAHKLHDLQAGLEAFGKLRGRMLEYARTTGDDLRGHYVERERCDAYQWLLLISSHAQRHILQIREIKAGPKFPKP